MALYDSIAVTPAYFDAQLNHIGERGQPRAPRPFLTISREAGSGGSLLAAKLCQCLNAERADDEPQWNVFDRNLVEKLLEDKQLSTRLARFLPEDRISEVKAAVGEIVGLHPSLWTLMTEANAMIRRLAAMGNVILVGRGATFATAGLPQGIHLRTIGSHLGRAERTALACHISIPAALAQNRKADTAAQKYVRSLFDSDLNDPHAYDLLINTDRLTMDLAAAHVLALVQARSGVARSAAA